MHCPNCGHENPDGNIFCRYCREPLAAKPVSQQPAVERTPSANPRSSPEWQAQGPSDTSEQPKNQRAKEKPQKSKQAKTKVKSKRPKKTKTVYKTKPRKQKSSRRGRREMQTVKKRGGFLAAFLAFILLAVVAVVIAGAMIINHYGLQTILNHFGYQVTSVQSETSSSYPEQSALPETSSQLPQGKPESDNSQSQLPSDTQPSEPEDASDSD